MNNNNIDTQATPFSLFLASDAARKDKSHALGLAISEALIEGFDADCLSCDCDDGGVDDAGMYLEDGCTTFLMKNHAEMIAFAETLASEAGVDCLNTYIHSSIEEELELKDIEGVLKNNIKIMTNEIRECFYYVSEWLVRCKLNMMLGEYREAHA